MEPLSDSIQLQLHFVDSVQRRYEVIRPIVLLRDRPGAQRAEETPLPPETVRDLTRRLRHQGMLGLFPAHTELVTPRRGKTPRKRGGGTGTTASALRRLGLSRISPDSLAQAP